MPVLLLLAPAKTLDETPVKCSITSTPTFDKEASFLASECGKLSASELNSLLGVKGNIGALNYRRYADWESLPTKQAGYMLTGSAYKTLAFPEFKKKEMQFGQQHLRILCGLYGVLRPCDAIRPYRLDMSKKLRTSKGKDNYAFWGDRIAESLNEDLATLGKGVVVVNLASNEYFKAVNTKVLKAPVLTCKFPGASVYAKQARGAMTRFVIENGVGDVEGIKAFDGWVSAKGDTNSYKYSEAQSDDSNFVFLRQSGAAPNAKAAQKKRKPPAEMKRAKKKAKKSK